MERQPPADAYGSADEIEEMPLPPRMSPATAQFLHPINSHMMVSVVTKSRRRRGPPPPPRPPEADRERDRDVPAAAAAAAPIAFADEALCESERSEQVNTLLGTGGGMAACFACRFARPSVTAPAAREGIEMMHTLLRSAPAGTCRVSLALEMAVVFERHVRAPMNRYRREGEAECAEWHVRDLYDHYFTPLHERVDAVSSQETRALVLETALYNIERFGLYRWCEVKGLPGLQRVVREDTLKSYVATSAALSSLYAQRPSTLALAASAAPATAVAPGMVDTRRALLGPAPRRHT
jgi:hypothetical protein